MWPHCDMNLKETSTIYNMKGSITPCCSKGYLKPGGKEIQETTGCVGNLNLWEHQSPFLLLANTTVYTIQFDIFEMLLTEKHRVKLEPCRWNFYTS